MNLKLKSCLAFILCFTLLCISSIEATPSKNTEDYLDELKLTQNLIFTLAQNIIFPSPTTDINTIQPSFQSLNESLTKINEAIHVDMSTCDRNTTQARDLRLLEVSINYMHNALYELEIIFTSTAAPEKLIHLERYFNFRVYANNTFSLISTLGSI